MACAKAELDIAIFTRASFRSVPERTRPGRGADRGARERCPMVHDVGGEPSRAAISLEQHAFAPWELRVDAAMWTLTDATRPQGAALVVDELRRGIEALPDYDRLGYYERWLLSMIAILDERGAIDARAIGARAAEIVSERGAAHP